MNFYEKTISKKIDFIGKMCKIETSNILLHNNKVATREVVLKQNAACVLAVTKSKKIVLVKQYRYAMQQHLLEVPAGKMDENETSPLICAKRELLEETGFKSKHWLNLGPLIPCPGFCNEKVFLFMATNAFQAAQPCPDPDEFLEVKLFDFEEIYKKAANGFLKDAKTVCAILKAKFLIQEKIIKLN